MVGTYGLRSGERSLVRGKPMGSDRQRPGPKVAIKVAIGGPEYGAAKDVCFGGGRG